MFGAEIFSVSFLKQRNHLPSDCEWPWDEEVLRHMFVSSPLFSLFSSRSVALPDGRAASRRALWGWEPRLCKEAHPCRLSST